MRRIVGIMFVVHVANFLANHAISPSPSSMANQPQAFRKRQRTAAATFHLAFACSQNLHCAPATMMIFPWLCHEKTRGKERIAAKPRNSLGAFETPSTPLVGCLLTSEILFDS